MVDGEIEFGVEEFGDDVGGNFHRIERVGVVDGAEFESNTLRGFFDWWRSQPTQPPRRADFDVIDHWRQVPNFFFLRVIDADTFEFILVGEGVIRLVGHNNSGRRFSVNDADLPMGNFARYLRMVMRSRQCWRCSGNLAIYEREHIRFESMDCPLTDPSGQEITHFIGLMEPL
jgi:hypothetical protein